jgi:hypothetical protein
VSVITTVANPPDDIPCKVANAAGPKDASAALRRHAHPTLDAAASVRGQFLPQRRDQAQAGGWQLPSAAADQADRPGDPWLAQRDAYQLALIPLVQRQPRSTATTSRRSTRRRSSRRRTEARGRRAGRAIQTSAAVAAGRTPAQRNTAAPSTRPPSSP